MNFQEVNQQRKNNILRGFTQDLVKAQSAPQKYYYANTAENRKKGRVGQEIKGKEELANALEGARKSTSVVKQAERKPYNEKLNSKIKELQDWLNKDDEENDNLPEDQQGTSSKERQSKLKEFKELTGNTNYFNKNKFNSSTNSYEFFKIDGELAFSLDDNLKIK